MSKLLWILGAADPEMTAIEKMLHDAGEHVAFATFDGVRVHPGNAYRANGTTDAVDLSQRHAVLVECGFSFDLQGETTWVDHHRLGDPGYGKPPAEYWTASSLGQAVHLLAHNRVGISGDEPGQQYYDGTVRVCVFQSSDDFSDFEHVSVDDAHLIAAADHCLAAAYRGECPGVDPDELMQWRVRSRAAFQERAEADVLADVLAARKVLRSAPLVTLGMCNEDLDMFGQLAEWSGGDTVVTQVQHITAKDMRGQHTPELPEASAREGICFIADGLPDRDGRVKVVCQSGTPDQILAFMQKWAPSHGLVDVYGDPARGFAGGYIQ